MERKRYDFGDNEWHWSISDWKRVIQYSLRDNRADAERNARELASIAGAVGVKEGPNPRPYKPGGFHSHPGDGEGGPGTKERYRKLLEERE